MVRGATGLAAAWVLSCTPLVLPAISAELADSLGEASRAALAALPWIAWLGLPGRAGKPLADAAMAAPPICAGLGLDLARGGDPIRLAFLACASIAILLALATAANLAARDPRRARAYALAWLALVPGAPLLAICLGLGGAPTYGAPPGWLGWIAGASPLGWILARASPSAAGGTDLASAFAVLGACLVLLAVASVRREARTA